MDAFFSKIQNSLSGLENNTNNNNDNKSLLQKQQITQQTINELLEKSSQALTCGPTCQRLKVSQELKQKYLDAQTNMQTAPIKLEETEKNYYVFTQGEPYYDNMKEEELKQTANSIATSLTEHFNTEISNANTMNTYLNTALINSKNTTELLHEYIDKNKTLQLSLRDRHGDILTNDRKTYYETDALNRLENWYKLFWYIYYLLVLVLILAMVLSPSELNIIKKLIIVILFMFYPYYVDYIFKFLYGLLIKISHHIPKNVYNDL